MHIYTEVTNARACAVDDHVNHISRSVECVASRRWKTDTQWWVGHCVFKMTAASIYLHV